MLQVCRIPMLPNKGCTSGSNAVNTVAPGIGYSAATKSGAYEHQRVLAAKFEFEFCPQCPLEWPLLIAAEYPIPGATVLTTFARDGQ